MLKYKEKWVGPATCYYWHWQFTSYYAMSSLWWSHQYSRFPGFWKVEEISAVSATVLVLLLVRSPQCRVRGRAVVVRRYGGFSAQSCSDTGPRHIFTTAETLEMCGPAGVTRHCVPWLSSADHLIHRRSSIGGTLKLIIYHTVNSLRSYLHLVNIVIVSIGHCVVMIM